MTYPRSLSRSRYTLVVYIAGYGPPSPEDLLHPNSRAAALSLVAAEQSRSERFGAGYSPPEALLWYGHLDDIIDVYPDFTLVVGPRGGYSWQRA